MGRGENGVILMDLDAVCVAAQSGPGIGRKGGGFFGDVKDAINGIAVFVGGFNLGDYNKSKRLAKEIRKPFRLSLFRYFVNS